MATPYMDFVAAQMQGLRARMTANMDAYQRNASRQSVRSLRVEQNANGVTLWGSRSWLVMEHGRGAGKIPRDLDKIIFQWSKDKGIRIAPMPYRRGRGKYTPEDRARWQFARAVAHRIAIEGTLLHRRGGFEDIMSTAIEETSNEVLQYLFDRTKSEIQYINAKLK